MEVNIRKVLPKSLPEIKTRLVQINLIQFDFHVVAYRIGKYVQRRWLHITHVQFLELDVQTRHEFRMQWGIEP